jgi:hypothetical protein
MKAQESHRKPTLINGQWKNQSHLTKVTYGIGLEQLAMVGMLPTPRVSAAYDSAIDRGKSNLGEVTGAGSQLNPRFVGEMMGFPENWTELPFQNGEPNQ